MPLTREVFAQRAYDGTLRPQRNALREVLDGCDSVWKTPPVLGIFVDIPARQLREDDLNAFARAGFTFLIADGEHSLGEARIGREHTATIIRLGMCPVQRLHREARSEHGDSLTLGNRGTMMPYASSVEEVQSFIECLHYPDIKPLSADAVAQPATCNSRGAFPLKDGAKNLLFTPQELRDIERDCQGWVQFETAELICDRAVRDEVLGLMQAQPRNSLVGFVGPFDAIMRSGEPAKIMADVDALGRDAADRGIHMGRVCGSGTCTDPKDIEDAMVQAIESGFRLISVHYLASEMAYVGAKEAAAPFWAACARAGF